MKTDIKDLSLLSVLITGLGLPLPSRVTAQTFTTLYSFTSSDGASPYASLILSGNTLYGTTSRGGSSGRGTVFAVNTDGTGLTILYRAVLRSTTPHGTPETSGHKCWPRRKKRRWESLP
jgi:uncharacterized repeat protein (TIGR03803 family)